MKILKKLANRMDSNRVRVYVVGIIIVLELFTQCHCSTSANTNIEDKISVDVNDYSDKLEDDVEQVTAHANLVSDSSSLPLTQQVTSNTLTSPSNNNLISEQQQQQYLYYTPSYETNSIPSVYSGADQPISKPLSSLPNYNIYQKQPIIHQLGINQTYYPQYDQTAYVSNNNYIQAPHPNQIQPTHHLVKITSAPFWEPDLMKLENQYMATFRSMIEASRASVMNVYYKMQDFVGYLMSFFTLGKRNSSLFFFLKKKQRF